MKNGLLTKIKMDCHRWQTFIQVLVTQFPLIHIKGEIKFVGIFDIF